MRYASSYHVFTNLCLTLVLSLHSILCVNHVKCQYVTLSTVPNSTIPDCSRFLPYTQRTLLAVEEPLLSHHAHRTAPYITYIPTSTAPASSAKDTASRPKVEPELEKLEYTCPENEGKDEDIFFCRHCGGAKEVTPWTGDGEPNAKCIGVGSSEVECVETSSSP